MRTSLNRLTRRNVRVGVTVVVLASCLAVMLALAVEVRNRLTALERASSDNVQWVMAQAEVEMLRLQGAVQEAIAQPEAGLQDLRLRFNLLFSRVAILQKSPIYAPVWTGPAFAPDLAIIKGFLDRNVPLIDGPDDALRDALPDLQRQMPQLHNLMRKLALQGTLDFAQMAADQRQTMARTLSRLAAATVLMMAVLSLLVIALLRLYRQTKAQAEVNRLTGARLATVVSTSVDGIIVTETTGQIIDFNPAAEAIFGLRREAVLGKDALKTLSPVDLAKPQQKLIDASLPMLTEAGAEPFRLEVDAQRADGTRFPVELSLMLAEAIPGEAAGKGKNRDLVVGFVRDISDRRRAEAALTEAAERAQAGERAKAEFIAVMSHEMRTPLNGMMGSVELLTDTALNARQRELVTVLERSGQILLGHVNSVLDLTRAEAGQTIPILRPVDLDGLVDDCVANQAGLAAAAATKIRVNALSGPIGMVMADPVRVGQIVLNLLGNAVKFTRDGTITVETEVVEPRHTLEGAQLVEVRVIDSGAGIPQDQLDRIFEDFVTLPGGAQTAVGTGLGLGISRRLAQAMGGEIGAESVVGEGSLFWFRLPLRAAPVAAEPAPRPALPLPDTTMLNILMIEDNAINRFILKDFLQSAGHRVTEASNGHAGLALAGATRFDVVLTDISMPGLDGVEVARSIRNGVLGGASKSARIFALTAHALPAEKARFREAGMDGCLIKPVNRADLLAALQSGAVPRDADVLALDQIDAMAAQIGPEQCAVILRKIRAEGDAMVALFAPDAGRDAETLLRACHQMAGLAGTIGAAKLLAQLTDVQTRLKTGAASKTRIRALPKLWREVATQLDSAIARNEAA